MTDALPSQADLEALAARYRAISTVLTKAERVTIQTAVQAGRIRAPWLERVPGEDDASEAPPAKPVPPPVSSVLATMWRPIGEWGTWLDSEPPVRRYLLSGMVDGKQAGIVALGKTGMLAAAGGSGKTWLTVELALCVATGHEWLGLKVDHPGRVLLVSGEEDSEELQRRLYWGCQLLGLTAYERELAYRRIVVLPLAGHATALNTGADDERHTRWSSEAAERDQADGLPVTALYWHMLDRLEADTEEEWSLIIVDPLSRFAGPDTERDNAAATLFVQSLERLTLVHGNPTVLVSHHTSKLSRAEGHSTSSDSAAAGAARGASGLTDGVRFQFNLEPLRRAAGAPELAALRMVKNNCGGYPLEITLRRDSDRHGALRLAKPEELAEREECIESAKLESARAKEIQADELLLKRVVEQLDVAKGPLSTRELQENLRKRTKDILYVLHIGVERGQVERWRQGKAQGWQSSSKKDAFPRFPPVSDAVPGNAGAGPASVSFPAPLVGGGKGNGTAPTPTNRAEQMTIPETGSASDEPEGAGQ